MPIISNFPSGGTTNGDGITLGAVSNITTISAYNRLYIKWTDPEDLIDENGNILATHAGTLLVRNENHPPVSRFDGKEVFNEKRNNSDIYVCDSGLETDKTYYYKLFPYTTSGAYTDSSAYNAFTATTKSNAPGDVTNVDIVYGNGKIFLKWSDPDDTIVDDNGQSIITSEWGGTKVILKKGSAPKNADDGTLIIDCKTRNKYSKSDLCITDLDKNSKYYIGIFPYDKGGATNINKITEDVMPQSLGDMSWSKISNISKSGYACKIFEIDDTKPITLTKVNTESNEAKAYTYNAQIIAFDHDKVTDSSNYNNKATAGITFQLVEIPRTAPMSSPNYLSGDNTRGWIYSYMRNNILGIKKNDLDNLDILDSNITILDRLGLSNEDLYNVLVPVTKTSYSSSHPEETTSSDILFLPSEFEIFGKITNSSAAEGSQYSYYQCGNRRVKLLYSTQENGIWWTRSASAGDSTNYCFIGVGGDSGIAVSYYWHGIPFCFCV